jgi:hypothetical protein
MDLAPEKTLRRAGVIFFAGYALGVFVALLVVAWLVS